MEADCPVNRTRLPPASLMWVTMGAQSKQGRRGLQDLNWKESWVLNRLEPGQCRGFQWEQQSTGEGRWGARPCSATSGAVEGGGDSRGSSYKTNSYHSNTHLRWFQIEQGCSSKRREGGRKFGIPMCLLQYFKATFTGNWDWASNRLI